MVEETHKTSSDGNTRLAPRSQGVRRGTSSNMSAKQGNERISRNSYQQTRLQGLRSSQLCQDILQKSNPACQQSISDKSNQKQDQQISILPTQVSKKARIQKQMNYLFGKTKQLFKQLRSQLKSIRSQATIILLYQTLEILINCYLMIHQSTLSDTRPLKSSNSYAASLLMANHNLDSYKQRGANLSHLQSQQGQIPTSIFTKYSMQVGNGGVKEFISAYFIIDLLLMLVRERRAMEFSPIYFFFFFGGTLLDLMILNDFNFLGVSSSVSKTSSSDLIEQFEANSSNSKDLLGIQSESIGFSRKQPSLNLVKGSTEKSVKQKKITQEKHHQNGIKKLVEKHGSSNNNNGQQNESLQQSQKQIKNTQNNILPLASSAIIAKPKEDEINQNNNQEISSSNEAIKSSLTVSPDRLPSEIKIVLTQTSSNRNNPPKPKTFTLSNLKTSEHTFNQIDNPNNKQPKKSEDKSINQIIPSSQKSKKPIERNNSETLERVNHSPMNNNINKISQKPTKNLSQSKKLETPSSQATNQKITLNLSKSNLPPHYPSLPSRNKLPTNASKPQSQIKKTHIYIEKKKYIQEQTMMNTSNMQDIKPTETLSQKSDQLGSIDKYSLDQGQHFCDDALGSTSGSVEGGVKTTTTDWDQKNDSAHERESMTNLVELKELVLNEQQEEDICSKLPSKNLSISSQKFCYEQDDDEEESGPTLQLRITPRQVYKEDDVHSDLIVQEESQKSLVNQFNKHRLNKWINEINCEKEVNNQQIIDNNLDISKTNKSTSPKINIVQENNMDTQRNTETNENIQNIIQLSSKDNLKYSSPEIQEQQIPSLALNFPFSSGLPESCLNLNSALTNQENIQENQKLSESIQPSPYLFESSEQIPYDFSNSRFSLEGNQFSQQEVILSQPFEIQQPEETSKPSIIQIKGRNGSHFEINITQENDLSSEFDRLAVSAGFSVEDTYITKIALFSNLSSIEENDNNIFKQQLQIITLEYALWELSRHEERTKLADGDQTQIVDVEMIKTFLKTPLIQDQNDTNETIDNSNSSSYHQHPTAFNSFNQINDWSNNNSAFNNRNFANSSSQCSPNPFYNQTSPLYCGFPTCNNPSQYYANQANFFDHLMQPQPQKFIKPHLLMQQTIRSARADEIKENKRSNELLEWNKKNNDRKQKNSYDYLQEPSQQQYPFQFFYPPTTRISRNKDTQGKEGSYMSQNQQSNSGKKSRASFANQSKKQGIQLTPSPIISTIPYKSRQSEMIISPTPPLMSSSNSLWSNSPYLLDSSNPCNNKTPPASSSNLFSSDLLNQLAQLGQPVN